MGKLASHVRAVLDLLFRILVRLVLATFYRRIEVVGRHHLPARPPRIYVGNHGNSIIDPAIALGWLPPGIRFLAKSTLWSHPAIGPFVRLVGAIPVFRRADPGVDTTRNEKMFSRCHQLLREGADIALFPEGISHAEPHLMPLKTGAARIALGTLAEDPATPLSIVPFGLVFENPSAFRSRVLLEIGTPINAAEFGTSARDHDSVRRLTARIEAGLAEVTVSYGSWKEAHLVRLAAHLYRLKADGRAPARLAEGVPQYRAFAGAYGKIKSAFPEETARVRRSLDRYDRLLGLAGLSDRQVATRHPMSTIVRFVVQSLLQLVVLLPVGIVGTLINWLPYRIPGWTVARLDLEEDVKATYKVMISLFLFPLFWTALTLLVAHEFNWGVALTFALIAPLSGFAALRLRERLGSIVSESRAFLMLRNHRTLARTLREQREQALEGLENLIRLHGEG